MANVRDLLRYRPVRALACSVAAGYIRLVRATGSWTIENSEEVSRRVAEGKPFIACFWHGRLMMIPHAWTYPKPIHILISRHRDGRMIADVLERFGIRTISGSSSKGGETALLKMIRTLRKGEFVALTPDGPRGPRMRASVGVIRTAQKTGVPIVPVSFSASRRKVLGSWDRFLLALPFSRGVIKIGAFMEVPGDADSDALDVYRRRLENELNALTNELDARFGFDAIDAHPLADDDKSVTASGAKSLEGRS